MQTSLRMQAIAYMLWATFAAASPYEQYILAPSSRTLHPVTVYGVNGTVNGAESLTNSTGSAVFIGQNSSVTYDYGKNIAGVVSLGVGDVSDQSQSVGLTYTESSLWISGEGSDGTEITGSDEVIWLQPSGPGTYAVSREHERGAFRYLSLILNTTGSIEITSVTTNFTAMPHYADDALRNYTGYFHSDDEKLNRVWYAGAYTNQLCTIDPAHGDALAHLNQNYSVPATWYNNYTITNGSSALVDGAKRDRLVWPGDMSISTPSIFVSTNDLITVRNSLDSLIALQSPSGQLPYAGVPFFEINPTFSFTYHLYTLIGVSYYYQFSGDVDYLSANWIPFQKGLNYSLSTIDSSGLMEVTSSADWLRSGMGGHNIEANAILYYTINQGITLASVLNDTSVISNWSSYADGVKAAANTLLWNDTAGLFHDNENSTLQPQDGNSWAIKANLTLSPSQNAAISAALQARWTPFGPPAVEAENAVSPFISGFELEAHFLSGQPEAALDLIRFMWADFMLDDPRMTNSTFIEGYSSDGSLHYAPYTFDPRVSHAHGWATGPTYVLSFYVAGLQMKSAGGREWWVAPQLGNLTRVEAGYETSLGAFSVSIAVSESEGMQFIQMNFSTPEGTTGGISLPYSGCTGNVSSVQGVNVGTVTEVAETIAPSSSPVEVNGLAGGDYRVQLACS